MKEARKLAVMFVAVFLGSLGGVCGGYVLTYAFHYVMTH